MLRCVFLRPTAVAGHNRHLCVGCGHLLNSAVKFGGHLCRKVKSPSLKQYTSGPNFNPREPDSSDHLEAFKFKQFSVEHDRCAHRIGTDSVLLGAWVAQELGGSSIDCALDVGTGSGVLALILAQTFAPKAQIHGVEIEENAYQQAQDNFHNSPWSQNLHPHLGSFQTFASTHDKTFDLIVSNPPYFVSARSYKSPLQPRAAARHTDLLPFPALATGVKTLLSDNGSFTLILPPEAAAEFRSAALDEQLFCSKVVHVRSKEGQTTDKRCIMKFVHAASSTSETLLYIHNQSGGGYTQAYRQLTSAYYLT